MDDLISRQSAIDAADRADYTGLAVEDVKKVTDEVVKEIKKLPPAQPERKTGHWVETGDEPYDEWECDVCGFVIDGSGCIDPEEYRDVYRFCPNCGAKMDGGEEHETD